MQVDHGMLSRHRQIKGIGTDKPAGDEMFLSGNCIYKKLHHSAATEVAGDITLYVVCDLFFSRDQCRTGCVRALLTCNPSRGCVLKVF